MTILHHINNPNWVAEREKLWEICKDYTITSRDHNKRERNTYKDFFFTGNFETFLKKLKPEYLPQFQSLLELFPANNLSDIQEFTSEYWNYVKDHDERYLFDPSSWVATAFERITFQGIYFSTDLRVNVFNWFYGDKFKKELSPEIDVSSIGIRITIDAFKQFKGLTNGLYTRLFHKPIMYKSEDEFFIETIEYYYTIFPFVFNEILTLEFPEISEESAHFINAQFSFRRLLLALLFSYDYEENEKLQSYHSEEQERLMNDLLHHLAMPDEFYRLIDYLKEVKGEALELEV